MNLLGSFFSSRVLTEEIDWIIEENYKIELEIRNNYKDREIGLMNRENLNKNKGMIFIYERIEPINIWMYKTFIPLDIIFIRKNQIRNISKHARPCLKLPCKIYPSLEPIDMVIEINAGLSKELNLKIGDYLDLRNIEKYKID
tara:strand:+ start:225 stop:653 length:429 start_codon:yes stop_codon:yes gene_type:complete